MLAIMYLIDKVLPFSKKGIDLLVLNVYQLFIQRYGVGKTISNRLLLFSGIRDVVRLIDLKENDVNSEIRSVFIKGEGNLDVFLERKMVISLQNSIDLFDYRGSLYKYKLPLNGQRRRANAKTSKRVRPIKLV